MYRERARELVTRLVERYAGHPALELWHVNNEYGCHVSHCYCDVSAAAFRAWLAAKYGTVDELNRAWGTAFWSQRYDSFDEVRPPSAAPTFKNPTQLLDFDRFSSDELLACYRSEVEVIRAGSDVPITTNFMGFFKPVDYWKWAREVDIVSDDTYPDPADPLSPAYAGMVRDLMRSLGGGDPWLLMEQSPSAVNWRARNAPKAPGQMRAWSYQSIARGADGILFFQWRQSAAGSEKFHSGMVPHGGTDTRVWREIEQLGTELRALSAGTGDDAVAGTRVASSVAIALDWDSWWAIEQPASPASVSYLEVLFAWHRAFTSLGLVVDFVRADGDLSSYGVVVAPGPLRRDRRAAREPRRLRRVRGRAARGLRHRDHRRGPARAPRRLPRRTAAAGARRLDRGVRPARGARPACDRRRGAASRRAQGRGARRGGRRRRMGGVRACRGRDDRWRTFTEGALAGWPAVTRRDAGSGAAWYVATLPEPEALATLAARAVADAGVEVPSPAAIGAQVEVVRRGGLVFAINHGPDDAEVLLRGTDVLTGSPMAGTVLAPQGVVVVRPEE